MVGDLKSERFSWFRVWARPVLEFHLILHSRWAFQKHDLATIVDSIIEALVAIEHHLMTSLALVRIRKQFTFAREALLWNWRLQLPSFLRSESLARSTFLKIFKMSLVHQQVSQDTKLHAIFDFYLFSICYINWWQFMYMRCQFRGFAPFWFVKGKNGGNMTYTKRGLFRLQLHLLVDQQKPSTQWWPEVPKL